MSITGTFGPHGVFGYFANKPTFNSKTDVPDMSGKVILVTGGTAGLGREAIKVLAKHNPAKIILAARTYRMTLSTIALIKEVAPGAECSYVECNLNSLESVATAAKQILSETERIDLMLNNAGVMCTERGTTKDGYENQFAVNHMGHALLTKLMLPTLQRTADLPGSGGGDVRVIFTTSMNHVWCPPGGIRFEELRSVQPSDGTWARYGQSKLANILYAQALALRHPAIKFLSVHPGVVNTNLILPLERRSLFLSAVHGLLSPFAGLLGVTEPEVGAENIIWAAAAGRDIVQTGCFFTPVGVKGQGSALSTDAKLAAKLYEWTDKELAKY